MCFAISKTTFGQILCIYCYDQNNTISSGVNNLILNGGFENGNCPPFNGTLYSFCPISVYYNCDIVNWTCTGGGTSTYAMIFDTSRTPIVEGIMSAYFGNYYCNSCSNSTNDIGCLQDSFCTVNGIPAGYPMHTDTGFGYGVGVSLEQTVQGLTIGNSYVLEFWAGGEDGGLNLSPGLFAVDVGFGKIFLRDKGTFTLSIGTRFIIEFNATSSSHTIKFTSWGHICNTCTELVLDDVKLYALAELSEFVPHCDVGEKDLSTIEHQINISPNLTLNSFVIRNIPLNKRLLLRIINPVGEIVYSEMLSGKNEYQVNANLSPGFYFINLYDGEKSTVGKLMVE